MKSKSFLFILSAFAAATIALAEPSGSDSNAIVSHIPRERVQSSGLASVGYSKRRHILEIELNNGAVYRYGNVSAIDVLRPRLSRIEDAILRA